MRIAIQGCMFASGEAATAKNYIAAGKNKGIDIREFYSVQEIESFEPDFVLNFNCVFPKLTRFPTYAAVVCPLEQLATTILYPLGPVKEFTNLYLHTFDGYFTYSEKKLKSFLNDICFSANKAPPVITAPGHYAVNFDFPLADLKNAHLVYTGHNWDKRNIEMLSLLSQHKWFNVYGLERMWQGYNVNYKGEIPYDECSLLNTYRHAGAGISLQNADFVDYDIVSNRIFEITASGAVAIVQRMPFIEEHFGDSILYIDHTKSDKEIYKDVVAHMDWIRNNPNEAAAKAHRANQITRDKFSSEQMLDRFVNYHQESMKYGGWSLSIPKQSQPEVAVIVRAGGKSIEMLRRSFDSLKKQVYQNIRPILVFHKKPDYLEEFLKEYRPYFSQIDVVECLDDIRSTTLWGGLNYVNNQKIPYFCILDDNEFFPNHISNLFETLQRNSQEGGTAQWAYSLWLIETEDEGFPYWDIRENRKFLHYAPLAKSIEEEIQALSTVCVLIKTCLLDQNILQDPSMRFDEDIYLWRKLFLKNLPVPSFRATALQHRGKTASTELGFSFTDRAFDQLKLKTRFLGQREPAGTFCETDINIEMTSLNKVYDNQIAESILNRDSLKRLLRILIRCLKIFKKIILKSPMLLKKILLKIEKI